MVSSCYAWSLTSKAAAFSSRNAYTLAACSYASNFLSIANGLVRTLCPPRYRNIIPLRPEGRRISSAEARTQSTHCDTYKVKKIINIKMTN